MKPEAHTQINDRDPPKIAGPAIWREIFAATLETWRENQPSKTFPNPGPHSPKKNPFRKHPSFPTNYKGFYKPPLATAGRPPFSRRRRGVAGDDLVRSDLRCGPSGEGRVSMAKKWSNSDESYEARSSGSTDSEEEAKNAEIEQEDEEEIEAVGKAVAGDVPGQDSSSTEDDGGAELGGNEEEDDDDDDDVR